MITLTDEMLERLKQKELEILRVVHAICKKYDLRYFLVCGTLIGAVRHKGFIPWDDDIDIAMLRNDFERFLEVAQEELGDQYFLQTTKTDRWSMPIVKVRMNGTVFQDAKSSNTKCHHGIFIDIFPLDKVKNPQSVSFRMRAKTIKALSMIFNCKYGFGDQNARSPVKQFLGKLISFFLPAGLIETLRYRLMTWDRKTEAEYVTSYASNYSVYKQLFTEDSYIPPKELEYEGDFFMVPGQYEKILTQLFGDYMQLPPEKERFSKHIVSKIEF